MIIGFTYEYAYQDREYIVRTMNTMHAPCIHSACNQTAHVVFLLQAASAIALCQHVCDQDAHLCDLQQLMTYGHGTWGCEGVYARGFVGVVYESVNGDLLIN